MPKPTKTDVPGIIDACEYARTLEKPNLSQIVREFGVLYSILYNRLRRNHQPATLRKPQNKVLNDIQEEALAYWIIQIDNANIPVFMSMVVDRANTYLVDTAISRTVNERWVYRFLERYPDTDMKLQRQVLVDKAYIDAEDIAELENWYNQLEILLRDIPQRLIFNFDETGF